MTGRRPLSIDQRSALRRMVDRDLVKTDRPDGAWRFPDLLGSDEFVKKADLDALQERGLVAFDRSPARASLSRDGRRLLADLWRESAERSALAQKDYAAWIQRRSRAVRRGRRR